MKLFESLQALPFSSAEIAAVLKQLTFLNSYKPLRIEVTSKSGVVVTLDNGRVTDDAGSIY